MPLLAGVNKTMTEAERQSTIEKNLAAYKDKVKKEKEDVLVIGSVYLIKSGKFYKVGRSNSTGRRHYELSIQLPESAEVIHSILLY